ncbi:hypothetical protein G6F63_013216 [Rhizopus arrhizus]|nr:hypothetical protein G6F63_013216 [Rhizopus arrhizus]
MAGRTLGGVQRLAAARVRGQRAVDRPCTGRSDAGALGHRTAQPCHVAAVDALGQSDHLARARHVARIGTTTGIEVVVAEGPLALGHVARIAVQIVADIVRQQPRGLIEKAASEHHRLGVAERGDLFGAGRLVMPHHLALCIEHVDRAGRGGIQVRVEMVIGKGAGTGQHQVVAGGSGDGFALGRVQAIKQVGDIHAPILRHRRRGSCDHLGGQCVRLLTQFRHGQAFPQAADAQAAEHAQSCLRLAAGGTQAITRHCAVQAQPVRARAGQPIGLQLLQQGIAQRAGTGFHAGGVDHPADRPLLFIARGIAAGQLHGAALAPDAACNCESTSSAMRWRCTSQ